MTTNPLGAVFSRGAAPDRIRLMDSVPRGGSGPARRSADFAEWLVEEVWLDVAHRHLVFTIPKALRGLIERGRRLHGLMARAAWETLREMLSQAACEPLGLLPRPRRLPPGRLDGDHVLSEQSRVEGPECTQARMRARVPAHDL